MPVAEQDGDPARALGFDRRRGSPVRARPRRGCRRPAPPRRRSARSWRSQARSRRHRPSSAPGRSAVPRPVRRRRRGSRPAGRRMRRWPVSTALSGRRGARRRRRRRGHRARRRGSAGGFSLRKRCLSISSVSGSMQALAEADAEAAADDHGFGVDQVDGGGDPGPERLDRALDQLFGEVVAVVEGALPDAAGQPRFLVLLHQLEEVGLVALLVLAARLGFHRRAAGVGLHAAPAPAGALGAAALDDHVADLPGGAAAEPGLAVEDEAAADAGSPEDPDQALELAPAPRWNSASVATWTSLPTRTSVPSVLLQAFPPAGSCRSQSGRFLALETTPVFSSASPGEPTPTPSRSAGSTPAALGRLAQAAGHLLGDPGGAAVGRRRPPRFAQHLTAGVDDRRLDLGPAKVDPTAQVGHRRSLFATAASFGPLHRGRRPIPRYARI